MIVAAAPAHSEPADKSASGSEVLRYFKPVGELASLSFRLGLDSRAGSQLGTGPTLMYSGWSFSDASLSGEVFGRGFWGGAISIDRQAFRLNVSPSVPVSLWRGSLTGGTRVRVGAFRASLFAGYGISDLAGFDTLQTRAFVPAVRQALVVGGKVRWDLPIGMMLEARAQAPTLSITRTMGTSVPSNGLTLASALIAPVGAVGRTLWALRMEGEYDWDHFGPASGTEGLQRTWRLNLGLEIAWLAAPPRVLPTYGELVITVLNEESGAAISGADIRLESGHEILSARTGADGTLRLRDLTPGEMRIDVSAVSYFGKEAAVQIRRAKQSALQVRLRHEPTDKGSLLLTIFDRKTAAPISEGRVLIRGEEHPLAADGVLVLENLPPGIVPVTVVAPGYETREDLITLVPGKRTSVPMLLTRHEQSKTVIRGQVHNEDGEPIDATVQIPEKKILVRVDATGNFSLLPGEGPFHLRISAPGYLSQRRGMSLEEGEQVMLDVILQRK